MSDKFMLALDEGTSSTRAIVFDESGSMRGVCQTEFEQFFPKPGWVEHDANEIWSKQIEVIKGAIKDAGIKPDQIAGLGITNQRETIVLWDRSTGEPLHHAIVWQDRRTTAFCDQLRADGHAVRTDGDFPGVPRVQSGGVVGAVVVHRERGADGPNVLDRNRDAARARIPVVNLELVS